MCFVCAGGGRVSFPFVGKGSPSKAILLHVFFFFFGGGGGGAAMVEKVASLSKLNPIHPPLFLETPSLGRGSAYHTKPQTLSPTPKGSNVVPFWVRYRRF